MENNPLRYVDPSGHVLCESGGSCGDTSYDTGYTSSNDYKLPQNYEGYVNDPNGIWLKYFFGNSPINQFSGFDNLLNASAKGQLDELKNYWGKYNSAGSYGNGSKNGVEIEGLKLRSNACSYLVNGCDGGSTSFFGKGDGSLLLQYSKDGKTQFIEATRGADGNLENNEIFLVADLHHSYPKYLGGASDQALTFIPRSDHQLLHSQLRQFEGGWMGAKRGYTGVRIQGIYGQSGIVNGLSRFYTQYYPEMLKDFEDAVKYTGKK